MSKGYWYWLRAEAEQHGLTIPQLATFLGVSPQTVHHWVNGRNAPDFAHIQKLAYLFFEGSIERLADKAGVRVARGDFLEEVQAHAEAASLDVFQFAHPEPPSAIPLLIPDEALRHAPESTLQRLFTDAADLLKQTGQYQQLRAQTRQLLSRMAGQQNPLVAQLYFDLAYAELMLGHYPDGAHAAHLSRQALRPSDDTTLLSDTHWLSSECLRIMGDLAEAYRHCEEASQIYRRAKVLPHLMGPIWVMWNQARIDTASGRHVAAGERLHHIKDVAFRNGWRDAEIAALWGLGYLHEIQSEFQDATRRYQQSQALARRLNDKYWEATNDWRLAEIARRAGRFTEAITKAKTLRRTFALIGNENMKANLDCALAASHLHLGLFDEAAVEYREAKKIFAADHDLPMEHWAALGVLLAALGQESLSPQPDFRKWLEHAPSPAASDSYNHYVQVYESLAHAEVLRLTGQSSEALEAYDGAAQQCLFESSLEYAHALLGTAATLPQVGQDNRALGHQALNLYQQLGSPWGQIHALILLAQIERHAGQSPNAFLHEAERIARKFSLAVERELIRVGSISADAFTERHVLLFV